MSKQQAVAGGWNQAVIDEFRRTGGRVDSLGFGDDLVLLHHIGARSGIERTTPVFALRDADGWHVAASAGGARHDPAWYRNVVAHPNTWIEAPGLGAVAVRAVVLDGEARTAAWEHFVRVAPGFASYEVRAGRRIPVLALRRREAAG